MKCAFLENFSLSTLLAPVTNDQFRAHHWERLPLLVRRNDPNFYGDLFSLEDFDREVASTPAYVKIAEAKKNKNVRHEGGSTPGLEGILADMQSGATLVMDALQQREHKLRLLCRLLEQQLHYRFQTNLYLTPPSGQGFTPHWDNHDVFILQVLGSKNWKLDKRRKAFPSRNDIIDDKDRVIAPDADAFTLMQGDLIYIPRGFVHAAECGPEPSLHITLGVHPSTWSDLLSATVKAIIKDNPNLHMALPFGFMHGSREDLVKGAMAAFTKAADETYVSAVIDQFNDELATRFGLDVSGQITAFIRPSELTSDDVVGPRAGVVYRLHVEGENVRVNYGGRKIVFPSFLAEPLKFALNTATYAIREIEGDLEESEKLVFTERLMQEGLVVRK